MRMGQAAETCTMKILFPALRILKKMQKKESGLDLLFSASIEKI